MKNKYIKRLHLVFRNPDESIIDDSGATCHVQTHYGRYGKPDGFDLIGKNICKWFPTQFKARQYARDIGRPVYSERASNSPRSSKTVIYTSTSRNSDPDFGPQFYKYKRV